MTLDTIGCASAGSKVADIPRRALAAGCDRAPTNSERPPIRKPARRLTARSRMSDAPTAIDCVAHKVNPPRTGTGGGGGSDRPGGGGGGGPPPAGPPPPPPPPPRPLHHLFPPPPP